MTLDKGRQKGSEDPAATYHRMHMANGLFQVDDLQSVRWTPFLPVSGPPSLEGTYTSIVGTCHYQRLKQAT
jgi:hypothetical protein